MDELHRKYRSIVVTFESVIARVIINIAEGEALLRRSISQSDQQQLREMMQQQKNVLIELNEKYLNALREVKREIQDYLRRNGFSNLI